MYAHTEGAALAMLIGNYEIIEITLREREPALDNNVPSIVESWGFNDHGGVNSTGTASVVL